ncbi:DNA-directed RNA polymerase III subunit RPC3 [Pyxicephalus adspersus]|uniref:DNA-directed RNA polymerase III subunit RPC3 n=1 Tax=Pyxicephalus adspersus TaxID=30357 RepID=UPI003B5C5FED
MTQAEAKLSSLLLREHFGEIVERVGSFLIKTGSQPLRVIAKDTDTPLDQVYSSDIYGSPASPSLSLPMCFPLQVTQDEGIYWQINIERFHQHFRDQAIISAVSNKMDQTSSEIVRTMLRMSEITTSSNAAHTHPLSSNEIFRSFPPGYNISKQVLDQYLALLADDPLEFVGRTGDSGGGMFVINLHKAVATLATSNLESIVQERIEEMITAPERQQLENLKRNVNKLDASEIQVDDTIFILEAYINSTKARA